MLSLAAVSLVKDIAAIASSLLAFVLLMVAICCVGLFFLVHELFLPCSHAYFTSLPLVGVDPGQDGTSIKIRGVLCD